MFNKLFTSESVAPGHPDKLCDNISDALLDATLELDPNAHCAYECFATKDLLIISGEVTSTKAPDYKKIAKEVIRKVGYTNIEYGFSENVEMIIRIKEQSVNIANAVSNSLDSHDLGAGDQGLMFGYATDETKEYMPISFVLANELMYRAYQLRKTNAFVHSRPDMKSQVTYDYENQRIDTIVISVQHDPVQEKELIEFKEFIRINIVEYVVKKYNLNLDYKTFVNPSQQFIIGGPEGDVGLTGRKIIVDTYGGVAHHGGGAFSGKDPTKVDRSGAYMCRYIAKNIVASGIAKKIEIQIAYAIGVSQPVSIAIEDFNTAVLSEEKIIQIIKDNFPLTPSGIIKALDLKKPIYQRTASFGHFGRENEEFTWEKLDKVETLKTYLK